MINKCIFLRSPVEAVTIDTWQGGLGAGGVNRQTQKATDWGSLPGGGPKDSAVVCRNLPWKALLPKLPSHLAFSCLPRTHLYFTGSFFSHQVFKKYQVGLRGTLMSSLSGEQATPPSSSGHPAHPHKVSTAGRGL